jgi:hypothetical protein
MTTVAGELRALLPVWAFAVLLPLPAATFWQEGSGRAFAYAYLFLGCAVVAAESFRRAGEGERPAQDEGRWQAKLTAVALSAGGAAAVFTLFAWTLPGDFDVVVPVLAGLAVVPAVCCVPWLTLATRRPFAGVLFTALMLGAVKLAGCAVVWFVYGQGAQAQGHMDLPWEQPNLLVWLCLAGMAMCSAACYGKGRRAFSQVASLAPASDTRP